MQEAMCFYFIILNSKLLFNVLRMCCRINDDVFFVDSEQTQAMELKTNPGRYAPNQTPGSRT